MEEQDKTIQASESVEVQPVADLITAVTGPVAEPKPGWKSFVAKNFLGLSILIAGVMISGSLVYSGTGGGSGLAQIQGAPEDTKVADVSADDDPFMGKKDAKVTIVEFSDYQCPFCRTFWKGALIQIKKQYVDTGKVRFVYRDFPLSFHAMAEPTAQASECADEQGKYWEFHDKVFGEQDKKGQGTVTYTANDLKTWASQIGLDAAKFNQCLDSGKYKGEVDKDFQDAQAAGVSGTPTFFINGIKLVGAQPFESFKAIIEAELKK